MQCLNDIYTIDRPTLVTAMNYLDIAYTSHLWCRNDTENGLPWSKNLLHNNLESA
jgi:hypothetical protein